jgi:hypothetical protein
MSHGDGASTQKKAKNENESGEYENENEYLSDDMSSYDDVKRANGNGNGSDPCSGSAEYVRMNHGDGEISYSCASAIEDAACLVKVESWSDFDDPTWSGVDDLTCGGLDDQIWSGVDDPTCVGLDDQDCDGLRDQICGGPDDLVRLHGYGLLTYSCYGLDDLFLPVGLRCLCERLRSLDLFLPVGLRRSRE